MAMRRGRSFVSRLRVGLDFEFLVALVADGLFLSKPRDGIFFALRFLFALVAGEFTAGGEQGEHGDDQSGDGDTLFHTVSPLASRMLVSL